MRYLCRILLLVFCSIVLSSAVFALDVSSPQNNQTFTNTLLLNFSNDAPADFSYFWVNQQGDAIYNITLLNSLSFVESFDTSLLPDGKYTLLVTAKNANISESLNVSDLHIDNSVPTVSISSLLIDASGSVDVIVTVTDSSDIDSVHFELGEDIINPTRDGDQWSAHLELVPAEYTLTIVAKDQAGNTNAEESVAFSVQDSDESTEFSSSDFTIGTITDCWDYNNDQTTCESKNDCQWHEDPWGSWCEQKNCWNQWTQEGCNQAANASSSSYINKSCLWKDSEAHGWCNELNCWSFSGTNQSACESNAAGLNCDWKDVYDADNYVYPCTGHWGKDCWSYTTQSSCNEIAGCSWGECFEESCWTADTKTECDAATGYNGNACKWDSQYSNCYESGCWDYNNKTGCESNSCTWNNGYCSDKWCSDFSHTNESACESNAFNLTCTWASDGWCSDQGCWQNDNQTGCEALPNDCFWETSDGGGWCEELNCWSFWQNQSACINNTASLNCLWDSSSSYCYENISSKSCSDMINERDCTDTFYCHWNGGNSTCEDPGFSGEFDAWNPECYIFDANQTTCGQVLGCSWASNECESNATIEANGLSCSNINDSSLCNAISNLNTCCSWQGSSCAEDRFRTACWDQLEDPPEGAAHCEDYNAYTDESLCNQISNGPWYMPCDWNNATARCGPKLDEIFDTGEENLALIDNKKNCEFAGGKWVTESYCEGSVAVPTGRCEFKFNEETNCNKACYACDYQSDATAWTSAAQAQDACLGSKLGFCSFTADTSAPNGWGQCEVNEPIIMICGMNTCTEDCGVCTYMGDPNADNAQNRPSYYCSNSVKGCKWIPDLNYPTDESKGWCAPEAEKTCEDRCDKCYEQQTCTSYGAKKGDSSLASQCSWDSNTYICKPQNGADEMEICWDGIDNNNDGFIDCSDSMCFSDPFCGGGWMNTGKDCFSYEDNATCSTNNCTWVQENWGSWCDVPGAGCWKLDGTNQTTCEASGCEWHSSGSGWCEENWDSYDTCFNAQNSSSCSALGGNCTWVVDNWCQDVGGWCENEPSYTGAWVDCWSLYGQWGQEDSTGCSADAACRWQQDSWCQQQGNTSGWCDHKKWTCWQYNDQAACTNSSNSNDQWCNWRQDEWGSWCESKQDNAESCWDKYNQSSCTTGGCEWIDGLCDPPGFGGGWTGGSGTGTSGQGMNCWQYDGNQTGCNATNGCGWFEESHPFCDVDFSANCPQYSYNQTVCDGDDRCAWDAQSNFCGDKVFTCWQNNESTCNATSECSWSGNSCEPACFSSTEAACAGINITATNTSACRWIGGWCGGAMAAEFFDNMEGGEPIPLGVDSLGDASPSEIDIIEFGMKDMLNAFGFGIKVDNLTNAALCNDVKMGNTAGAGTNTTKFYWYLDTDGNRSNNCALGHNSSSLGYEFYFTYVVSWNNATKDINEKYNAYRCANGNFTAADIKLTSMRQLMCGDIGGGMIAVDKVDLEKLPKLYSPGQDIRVSVASASEAGNITNPTDQASAGFLTPGTIDFDLDSLDIHRLNGTQTDSISQGFVKYDADCWSATGCADYSCMNHPYCTANSLGVHASGFEDSQTPRIIAINRETYTDSALISYYTDKPANGTLMFYGNDSTCSNLTSTIYDKGVTSTSVRAYRLTHNSELYNDAGNNSLSADLNANKTYYFKLQVCDDAAKCGVSKCSSFSTPQTGECGFCNFVTKISAPSGWQVSYDLDQDGSYEHAQGQVCGPNAGMKTNYSSGRAANIKLAKTDNSSWIEFKSARLTKTGLGSKIRDIDNTSDLGSGTTTDADGNTIGYVGMISSTRDKIINNLYPERCSLRIPGTGSCDELWHCNDDLSACVNRTGEATLNETGSNYCIWDIPYCEFSNWVGGQPSGGSSSSSSSSSSSGGSGGGGSSSSAGGGGGGGAGASTARTGANVSASKTSWYSNAQVGEAYTMELHEQSDMPFTEIGFTPSQIIASLSLSVYKFDKNPLFEELDNAYAFFEIDPQGASANSFSSVSFSFLVDKSWLSANSFDADTISLYRFANDNWNKLSTTINSETESKILYTSSSPGFSFFSIAAEKASSQQHAPATQETSSDPTDSSQSGSALTGAVVADTGGEGKLLPIIAVIFGLVLVIALVLHFSPHAALRIEEVKPKKSKTSKKKKKK